MFSPLRFMQNRQNLKVSLLQYFKAVGKEAGEKQRDTTPRSSLQNHFDI